MLSYTETPVLTLQSSFLKDAGVTVKIKREDLNHPSVPGNKWWKLKHNLVEARYRGFRKMLTFGGAFSNHIRATAAACRLEGFDSVGVIRGEEPEHPNGSLLFAKSQGMALHFVSREAYRLKSTEEFKKTLHQEFGEWYLIPEGGSNELAVKGCAEWGNLLRSIHFNFACLPVGTGGTLAGLSAGLEDRTLLGFSVLREGRHLEEEVQRLQRSFAERLYPNWTIQQDYHFGGYAKASKSLLEFIDEFQKTYSIPLEPVYTGKMMYGVFDLIGKGYFPRGSTVLALHTGGLFVK